MNMKLFYDGEFSGMTPENCKDALEFIVASENACVGTMNENGTPRLSVITNLPGQQVNCLYFATDINSQKAKNLIANPFCELLYTNGHGQVILTGSIEVITDTEARKARWLPWMNEFFSDGPEGETMCLLKFTPQKVRAMIM